MPVNPTIEYQKAEREFSEARTISEKLSALHKMLQTAPSHKGAENLRAEIKSKIAKYKKLAEKEKQQRKKSSTQAIKKEGAATVCIVGTTNSGKSTLLKNLTNANVKISNYPYTTTKPEIGVLDYKGVKIQIIEIPSIIENYINTENGPFNLSIIRLADLLILTGNIGLVKKELEKEDINIKFIIYKNQENIKDIIWENLDLIKVYTKEPGKKPKFPPVPLKKGSTIKELAKEIHQDFIKKFKFARVQGTSVKHQNQHCGLNHKLHDEDIVELHIR